MGAWTDSSGEKSHAGTLRPNSRDEQETTPKSQPNPSDEIPNGGLKAWLQVLGSFMVFLNTWYPSLLHFVQLIGALH